MLAEPILHAGTSWKEVEQRTVKLRAGFNQSLTQAGLLQAILGLGVDLALIECIGTVDRGFVWVVTFEELEVARYLVSKRTICVDNLRCDVTYLAEKDTIVRVHWLPYHIPMSVVTEAAAEALGLEVVSGKFQVLRFDDLPTMNSTVRILKLKCRDFEEEEDIPLFLKVTFEGRLYTCMLSVLGLPPRCLKCYKRGHVRRDCPPVCRRCGSFDHTTQQHVQGTVQLTMAQRISPAPRDVQPTGTGDDPHEQEAMMQNGGSNPSPKDDDKVIDPQPEPTGDRTPIKLLFRKVKKDRVAEDEPRADQGTPGVSQEAPRDAQETPEVSQEAPRAAQEEPDVQLSEKEPVVTPESPGENDVSKEPLGSQESLSEIQGSGAATQRSGQGVDGSLRDMPLDFDDVLTPHQRSPEQSAEDPEDEDEDTEGFEVSRRRRKARKVSRASSRSRSRSLSLSRSGSDSAITGEATGVGGDTAGVIVTNRYCPLGSLIIDTSREDGEIISGDETTVRS